MFRPFPFPFPFPCPLPFPFPFALPLCGRERTMTGAPLIELRVAVSMRNVGRLFGWTAGSVAIDARFQIGSVPVGRLSSG